MRHTYGHDFKAICGVIIKFNQEIIKAIAPYAVAIKPQSAFYEPYGSLGIEALEQTILFAREAGLLVIMDGKRGDGGDTAEAYAQTYLGEVPSFAIESAGLRMTPSPLRSDALTVYGQIGEAWIKPLLHQMKLHQTGAFVVVKTSFKPNSIVEQIVSQEGSIPNAVPQNGLPFWQELAHLVDQWGEGTEGVEHYRNLGVVMGATYPDDARTMREILPNAWFLVPGYGAQGGGARDAVLGANTDGLGIVVNSSRGIIYAYCDEKSPFKTLSEHFALAAERSARAARDELNAALQFAGKG